MKTNIPYLSPSCGLLLLRTGQAINRTSYFDGSDAEDINFTYNDGSDDDD